MKSTDSRRIVFDIIKHRITGYSFDDFCHAMDGFQFIPIMVDKQMVGAVMRKGSELHAAVISSAKGRWMNKSILSIIAETMKDHGKATTVVMNDHIIGHWFAKRLGFVACGKNDCVTFYEKVKP